MIGTSSSLVAAPARSGPGGSTLRGAQPPAPWTAPLDRATVACLCLGLLCIAALLPVWLRMLVSPAPQEMREGAMLWSTSAFLHGHNAYAIETLPGPANVYGPLYPLLVVPLATWLGPTLLAHRLVNGAAILLACALLFRVLRREGVSRGAALAGAGLNLAGLLYWVGPTSRPDGVGMALLIGAYAVMAPNPASGRRFAAGLALSLLGLATKIYFVLPVLVAIAWTVVHHPRRGVGVGAAAGAAIVATMFGLASIFPAWAPIVLGANLSAVDYDLGHLARQSRDWAIFSLPLLAALAAGGHHRRESLDLWACALLSGVAAIVLKLGGHTGAHMTYLFHLVSPPLTVVALRAAERRTIARFAFAAALPVAAFLNAHWFTFDMARIARAEAVFARAATAIAAAKHPAATTEFAPLLLAAGVPPIETGHTEYFRAVAPPWYLAPLWSAMPPLEAAQTRFTKGFRSAVDAEAFDLVIADRRGLDLLSADALAGRYRPVEPFELDLAWAQQSWPADIWRPIRSTE
ncbi:MAG: hypothetical protein U0Q12_17585 [Vicinamibacterales bacterium]